MKKLLLVPIFLLVLYSCSPEEETKAPTSTVQSTTLEPEPETLPKQLPPKTITRDLRLRQ